MWTRRQGATALTATTSVTPEPDNDVDVDATMSSSHDHNNAASTLSNASTLITKEKTGWSWNHRANQSKLSLDFGF